MSTTAHNNPLKALDPLELHAKPKNYWWLSSWRFRYFLFVFLIYLLAAPLDITTTNPGSRFMLTKSFAKYWRFWILPEDQARYSHLDYSNYNGKIYSDKAPGPSILMVPFYWIAQLAYLAQAFLNQKTANDQEVDDLAKMLIVIFLLIFHAITVIRAYDLCRLLGFEHISSFLCSLVLGFASIWYPYTPTFFSHAIVGSLLIHSVFHLFKSKASSWTAKDLLLSGSYAAIALSAEYAVIFLIPCLIFYIMLPVRFSGLWLKEKARLLGIFWIPVSISGILLAGYHFVCFENPFSTPYKYARYFAMYQHFLEPIEDGLYVLLFSPSHGLFYFMPIASLSLICLPALYRRHPAETSLLISMFLIILIWISKFFKPDGGLAWSTRHLVPVTPLLIIPLAAGLQSRRKSFLFLFSVFGILSLIFNASAAWIRLWPTGGEGMTNPLFGSEGDKGHLERLFTWISVELASLNPLDWLVLSATGPQSTLYNKYPTAFWIICYFAIFSNPFFPLVPYNRPKHPLYNISLVSSPLEGLYACLGFGIIVISFLLAHITFLGVALSTKPAASELYELHESDLAFLGLVLLCWGIVIITEFKKTGIVGLGIRFQRAIVRVLFEILANCWLFYLVIFAGPIIDDPWLSALLSLGFIAPLACFTAISKDKWILGVNSTLIIIPMLLIWEFSLTAILVWGFVRFLLINSLDSNQNAEKIPFLPWLESMSRITTCSFIVAIVFSFALINGYFALESVQGLILTLTLIICLFEVSLRGIFSIRAIFYGSTPDQSFPSNTILLSILDFAMIAIGLIFIAEFLEMGMVSLLDLGLIVSFPQALTFAFWISTMIVIIVIAGDFLQQSPRDAQFKQSDH